MQHALHLYVSGDSFVHRCDARVKLVILLAYSLTLFLVETWVGLLLCAGACLTLLIVAGLPIKKLLILLGPLYVILAFTLVFNSFVFDSSSAALVAGNAGPGGTLFSDLEPISLFGTFSFTPQGFARGLYYSLRIILLVLASFILAFTTTSNALIDALNDFLRPLRRLHVPVDDLAMIVSIALRFIPVTAEELSRIRNAQASRGAHFDDGGVLTRMRAWQPVFIPLFVGLFHHANTLAVAMEARCYGMSNQRTQLNRSSFTLFSVAVMLFCIVLCALCSIFL